MLYVTDPAASLSFYMRAFAAVTHWTIPNPDGSVHVAEFSINGARIRLHQEAPQQQQCSPANLSATTVVIHITCEDPDGMAKAAIEAGAVLVSPVQDYDYGYRQGTLRDLSGHQWLVEKSSAAPPLGADIGKQSASYILLRNANSTQ